MNVHRIFYNANIKTKTLFLGFTNVILLIITFKIFNYIRNENKIKKHLKIYRNSRILLISGGPSIIQYFSEINKYDHIVLNSYQTLRNLDSTQIQAILDKTVLYYQAPFHEPLNLDDFKNNIEKIAEALQPKALIITDQKIQVTNSLRHKPLSYLHRFGFATFRQTGFLTLFYLVVKSGIKEIDMLGVDLNYSILEMQKSHVDERPISELISSESEVFYEIESLFRSTLKSGIKVNNLNNDSMVKIYR